MRVVKRRIGLTAALAVLSASAAVAQESRSSMRPPPTGTSDTYIVTLNANALVQPTFPGSDYTAFSMFPSLSFRKADEPARFSAPDDGISVSIIDNPTFRIGPVFRFQSGRYLEDDKLLFGLKKKNYDVESGLFIEYWPLTFIRARAELRHGFRSDSGLVGLFGIDYVQPIGQFVFSLGPRLYVGDKRYHDRWYGIRPYEAQINRLVAPYSPGGGLTGAGVTGAVTYQWNETWATTGYVNYRRLLDDVADSPIVTKIGSRDQFTVGARVSYSFGFTPWW
jgi:outer membrane scaffolding protein for murein synthesis (MipA/OmpV family)